VTRSHGKFVFSFKHILFTIFSPRAKLIEGDRASEFVAAKIGKVKIFLVCMGQQAK
jgi:hypothetical protein